MAYATTEENLHPFCSINVVFQLVQSLGSVISNLKLLMSLEIKELTLASCHHWRPRLELEDRSFSLLISFLPFSPFLFHCSVYAKSLEVVSNPIDLAVDLAAENARESNHEHTFLFALTLFLIRTSTSQKIPLKHHSFSVDILYGRQ